MANKFRTTVRLQKGGQPVLVEIQLKPGEDPYDTLLRLNETIPDEWEITLVPPDEGPHDGQIWS